MVAVQVIAAETDAAARRLFTTPQQRFLRLIRNQPVELLPPVDSMEPLWQDAGTGGRGEQTERGDCGIGCNGEGGAGEVGGDTGADEVIVVTDTYEHADRLESYRRVAGVAGKIEVKPTVAVEA